MIDLSWLEYIFIYFCLGALSVLSVEMHCKINELKEEVKNYVKDNESR